MHSLKILRDLFFLKKGLTFITVVVRGGRYFDVPPIRISRSAQTHSFGVRREGNFPEDADMWPLGYSHITPEAYDPCSCNGEEASLSEKVR